MLTYRLRTLLNQSFCELLAADLDDDARQFYTRTAADIAIVATGVNRPPRAPALAQTLLNALVAPPAASDVYWRQFYGEISDLVAEWDTAPVAEILRAENVRALGRLRQFLSENVDLTGPLAVEGVERTTVAGAGWA